MPNHTTSSEDSAIRACDSVGGNVQEVIDALTRLDELLTEANKDLDAQCAEIQSINADIEALQKENAQLKEFNDAWVAERHRIADAP